MLTRDHSGILEAPLSKAGIGIVVTDQSGTILFINNAGNALLAATNHNVVPEDWPRTYGIYLADGVTLCPPSQSPVARGILGEENATEVLIVRTDQALGRWCTLSYGPSKKTNGEIDGAILIIQDITERKKLAQEAARSNEALQQFAWVAAHDLQEPLRTVTGFLDLLAQRLSDQMDEKSRHYITRVRAGAGRMGNLIEDLLAYSRIQTKAQVLQVVDCNVTVKDCIEILTASIRRASATIVCDQLPTVVADRASLSQLFQNLLANALKFSAADRPPIVTVSAKRVAFEWVFSVKDNGIGIDMKFAERIFKAFQRLHPMSTYAGTGIGLAICKGIIDRHGGRIWIESEPAKEPGATFYFTLGVHAEDNLCQR